MTTFMYGIVVVSRADIPRMSGSCSSRAAMKRSASVLIPSHDVEARTLEHHRYEVLADVVDVALDRPDDDLPDGLRARLREQRAEDLHSGLHGVRGEEHLGHEEDSDRGSRSPRCACPRRAPRRAHASATSRVRAGCSCPRLPRAPSRRRGRCASARSAPRRRGSWGRCHSRRSSSPDLRLLAPYGGTVLSLGTVRAYRRRWSVSSTLSIGVAGVTGPIRLEAFALLPALADGPQRITDLSTRSRLAKGTVARLLATLELEGAVTEDPDSRYRLGPAIGSLAARVSVGPDLLTLARPGAPAPRGECRGGGWPVDRGRPARAIYRPGLDATRGPGAGLDRHDSTDARGLLGPRVPCGDVDRRGPRAPAGALEALTPRTITAAIGPRAGGWSWSVGPVMRGSVTSSPRASPQPPRWWSIETEGRSRRISTSMGPPPVPASGSDAQYDGDLSACARRVSTVIRKGADRPLRAGPRMVVVAYIRPTTWPSGSAKSAIDVSGATSVSGIISARHSPRPRAERRPWIVGVHVERDMPGPAVLGCADAARQVALAIHPVAVRVVRVELPAEDRGVELPQCLAVLASHFDMDHVVRHFWPPVHRSGDRPRAAHTRTTNGGDRN